ncbi:MAG: DUF3419 family protein [Saprospiraceae bacterium]|nr:DUF3419 family protein [Saprospiraceae bacterium]
MLKFEFEYRIFISLGIVAVVCFFNFAVFPELPENKELVGRLFGWSSQASAAVGFGLVAFMMVIATLLRMWAGTVLSSSLVMSFKIKKDVLNQEGPYQISRNPIYFADMIAYFGFAFCLSPIGFFIPFLLYFHYSRLIEYEEKNLELQFGKIFQTFKEQTPKFIPNKRSISRIGYALRRFKINWDGLRHDALYLLFIPGFIVSAFTGKVVHAIIIGLPAVMDWAIVHTKIGLDTGEKPMDKNGVNNSLGKSKVFEDIIYAQCWEDPEIDRSAFGTKPDDVVFSITSGGCNTLAFLVDDPKKVIALDLSPYQNYLLELKMAAFKEFSYEKLLQFLGVSPCAVRLEMYDRLRQYLSPESLAYWNAQPQKIQLGIIHCGRYEKYMHMLNKWLRLLVGKSLPEALFACQTQEARQRLFDTKWDTPRWRFFTNVFLSRATMTLLFTSRFFEQLESNFSFGEHFRSKIKRAITDLPLQENYFLSYILLGRFYSLEHLPSYLRKEHFEKIKSRLDRVEIVTDACEAYFRHLPPDSISKFNFTNVFEWMEPAAFENLLKETIRVAKDGAVMTYRNLLVPRSRPASLARWIAPQEAISSELLKADRSFIYKAYIVEKIVKPANAQLQFDKDEIHEMGNSQSFETAC